MALKKPIVTSTMPANQTQPTHAVTCDERAMPSS